MGTSSQAKVIPIWPDRAPGSEEWRQTEQETNGPLPYATKCIRNVSQPTLTVFLPDPAIATGTGVVVCPGGAFLFLSIDKEGTDVAGWLNARGVAAFVLKYRLVETEVDDSDFARQAHDLLSTHAAAAAYRPVVPLAIADGQQAVRVARAHSTEWGVAPDRIGILGFSAGGVVAASAALRYDAASRPDFAAPIYPGPLDDLTVPADAPPLFIAAASDDPMVPVARVNVPLYLAWIAAGRTAELHLYARGGHGAGLLKQGLPFDGWIDRFADWLQGQDLLQPRS